MEHILLAAGGGSGAVLCPSSQLAAAAAVATDKLNHFHIHLSDDGSFTFPSTKYPQLAAKAKFKYTLNELQELQA